MDNIHVTGIRAYGYTGYLPEERVLGQWFEVDLSIEVDLSVSGASDAIEDTIDYRRAIEFVKHRIQNERFALVEKLATAIAEDILTLDRVRSVRVRLSKPAAPIPDFGGKITIDITRSI
ncbi:dihydroneopterin aldolase [Pannus brasiliensis CCIBt3594]|uniref:7,8-dihydroneopterin aldolase n=1 Tax=Pannus brasiliensis CCIBt3594 TaxID=1427578 RepID=A0AAW9QJM9_9CHRO